MNTDYFVVEVAKACKRWNAQCIEVKTAEDFKRVFDMEKFFEKILWNIEDENSQEYWIAIANAVTDEMKEKEAENDD